MTNTLRYLLKLNLPKLSPAQVTLVTNPRAHLTTKAAPTGFLTDGTIVEQAKILLAMSLTSPWLLTLSVSFTRRDKEMSFRQKCTLKLPTHMVDLMPPSGLLRIPKESAIEDSITKVSEFLDERKQNKTF